MYALDHLVSEKIFVMAFSFLPECKEKLVQMFLEYVPFLYVCLNCILVLSIEPLVIFENLALTISSYVL